MYLSHEIAAKGAYLTHFHWSVAVVVVIVGGLVGAVHHLLGKRGGGS